MRKITLNRIVDERAAIADPHTDTDEPGENVAQLTVETITTPVIINVDAIRCFNARKYNKPGTRITFIDGGAFVVSNTVDEVDALTNEPGTAPVVAAPVEPITEAASAATRNGAAARNGTRAASRSASRAH